jgi:hypothetical protein
MLYQLQSLFKMKCDERMFMHGEVERMIEETVVAYLKI